MHFKYLTKQLFLSYLLDNDLINDAVQVYDKFPAKNSKYALFSLIIVKINIFRLHLYPVMHRDMFPFVVAAMDLYEFLHLLIVVVTVLVKKLFSILLQLIKVEYRLGRSKLNYTKSLAQFLSEIQNVNVYLGRNIILDCEQIVPLVGKMAL